MNRFTETIFKSRGGLLLARVTIETGWFERGSYGTHWGYVQVYRQQDSRKESGDYTRISFTLFGLCYDRAFLSCLSDAALKKQCTTLAQHAHAEIWARLEGG